MHIFKTALKETAWVFLLSRFIIILVSYISTVFIPLSGHSATATCLHVIHSPCLLAWYHWDAMAYITVASKGYASTPQVAFFPLWPLMIHFGGLLLGGHVPLSFYLAGLILTNIFFFFALVLLYCLLCEDFEPSLAKRALFYLAFYPYAIFFFAGYTESLFLLFSVAIFLLLRRGKALDWWFAGGIGFLAALTRSTGLLLSIPFFVMYIRHFWVPAQRPQHNWLQKINALVPIVLFPMGILVYMIYLGYTKGNPFIVQYEEATNWGRHFAWPWITYTHLITTFFTYARFSMVFVTNLLDITFTTLPIIALAWGWKRLPLHYSLFALAVIVFSLSFPLSNITPLASEPRYMMAIFPLFAIYALLGKHPRFDQLFMSLGPPLLAVFTILFVSHYWVA